MTGASIRNTLLLLAGLALAYTAVADDVSYTMADQMNSIAAEQQVTTEAG